MMQVEYLAGFLPVLNLRKGEHFSRLAIVKISSEAIRAFVQFAGLHPELHIAAVRPRTVARELLLIEGRANEIALEKLLRRGGTRGAQLTVLCGRRGLMNAVRGRCSGRDQHSNRHAKRPRKRSHGPCGDRFQISSHAATHPSHLSLIAPSAGKSEALGADFGHIEPNTGVVAELCPGHDAREGAEQE